MKIKRPFTQHAVDARKAIGLTQEQAAELLGVSTTQLQRYEADDSRIHDDVAASMAMVYHDPRLKRWYCENECQIGCQEHHCDCDRSAESLMLDLLLIDKDRLSEVIRALRDILADGRIDENEVATKDTCLAFLDSLSQQLEALKLQVQRVDSASRA